MPNPNKPVTDAEYITQHPNSEPLRKLRASIIGQIALKKVENETA